MKKQALIAAAAVIVFTCGLALAKTSEVVGDISTVTVYRGQALVSRTIDVDLPPGTSELIVKDLPAKIVPESLYAQTSSNITVLSVRYREKAVKEDTRKEVKAIDAQIQDVQSKLYHAERDLQHSNESFSRYRGFWKLAVDAANGDLNRGLLQSKPIEELTKYLETKSIQWHQENVKLENLKKSLQKELELLQRKRKELDAGRSRTEREAILFVNNDGRKKSVIELNYLVNDANWFPQYNLRASIDKTSVLIEYNAVVNQTSGENWNGVALSLSTAEPAMVAAPPILNPMFINLSHPAPAPAQQTSQRLMNFDSVQKQVQSRKASIRRGIAANEELNRLALDNQAFLLRASGQQVEQFQERLAAIARNEAVSVTYSLPGKLTLPSRSDQQLVSIASIPTKAQFFLVATPLLTDYVYLQAEILNDSNVVLLPGSASMFRNGDFAGKGNINLVTIGEKFAAGFGIDSQVQVARELEDKKTRIEGGNRIDTYDYRIALSNYKNTAAKLRLFDRLPYTENRSLTVEQFETNFDLSDDAEYLRTARKKGILRWDLNLKDNMFDEKATILTYTFRMKYDKDMQITTVK